jgi:hypothetical protein
MLTRIFEPMKEVATGGGPNGMRRNFIICSLYQIKEDEMGGHGGV